jgi:hypothetical protein
MRRLALAGLLGCVLAGIAGANGRPPGTSTIHFRPGSGSDIWVGLTFGELVSHDGGLTWQWMCEKTVGYAGTYDPVYAYSSSGAIFATTLMELPGMPGMTVMRDGCNFTATPLGTTFVSQDVIGPDGTLFVAAASPTDSSISQSSDDGMTLGSSSSPGIPNDWWESLVIAAGNGSNVFLSGYRFVMACDSNSPTPFMTCTQASQCQDATHPNGTCDGQEVLLLFDSHDHGATWQPLPGNLEFRTATTGVGLTTSTASVLDFVGTSSDGGKLYARVTYQNPSALSDGLYELDTGLGSGGSGSSAAQWTHLLTTADSMAVLARSNGDVVVGTKSLGSQILAAGGSAWTPLANPPHINCLVENAAHEIWACTQNFSANEIQGDGYGIMKTTDLANWTGVLRYQDTMAPVMCAADSIQQTQCVLPYMGMASVWCSIRAQISVTANPPVLNGSACDVGDGPGGNRPKKGGCCEAGDGETTVLAGCAVASALLLRRRRTTASTCRS